ncbi:MAG: NAD(P)-binding domain-containing protein [Pyrinomonadaceae bacterium]|nr:NAD(P)-binding domain-containing protein [Pyrinomonadaceae bacterium]
MYDLLVIGAGPAGIALAAEARAAGLDTSRVLLLEKGAAHTWAIRQFYPEQKLTTANYKGYAANCEGLLCITDMTKQEMIEFFDQIIESYGLNIRYGEEVYAMRRIEEPDGAYFRVESSQGVYESRVIAVAIGVLGRPNKPKEYRLPPSLKERLLFDITSHKIENETVLVVGGGDTAAEYVEHLYQQHNQLTLSYRQPELTRLNERNHATLMAMEQRGEVAILRASNILRVEDEGGRPRVFFKEEEHRPRTFDRIVYALGGTTPTNFLRALGIGFGEDGPVFDATGKTNVPGLFLIGDLTVSKTGGSIITAFNSSARAILRICENHLSCANVPG